MRKLRLKILYLSPMIKFVVTGNAGMELSSTWEFVSTIGRHILRIPYFQSSLTCLSFFFFDISLLIFKGIPSIVSYEIDPELLLMISNQPCCHVAFSFSYDWGVFDLLQLIFILMQKLNAFVSRDECSKTKDILIPV